jgi:protein gp37
MTPHDLACELAGYLQENHNASYGGIGYSSTSASFDVTVSGSRFRPMDLDWARSLRDQCQAAGVAFHFKQIGGRTHGAGGRDLDGRTWDEFPEPARTPVHV